MISRAVLVSICLVLVGCTDQAGVVMGGSVSPASSAQDGLVTSTNGSGGNAGSGSGSGTGGTGSGTTPDPRTAKNLILTLETTALSGADCPAALLASWKVSFQPRITNTPIVIPTPASIAADLPAACHFAQWILCDDPNSTGMCPAKATISSRSYRARRIYFSRQITRALPSSSKPSDPFPSLSK